jgi:hypothetical protein
MAHGKDVDIVLILGQDDQPVAGATVVAVRSGLGHGQVSAMMGTGGTVVLTELTQKPRTRGVVK